MAGAGDILVGAASAFQDERRTMPLDLNSAAEGGLPAGGREGTDGKGRGAGGA